MKRSLVYLASAVLLVLFFMSSGDVLGQGRGKGKNKNNNKDKEYVKEYKSEYKGKRKQQGPPPWAPAHGYRAKTRYVYFKDYDVYYDHERGVYITLSGKGWQVEAKLPDVLEKVDLPAAVKVDIDFDGLDPQKLHDEHLKLYPKKS
ncbi:hypothetical protein LVD15_21755 [Fulvivirga maritima]|uniref:hypothetical protein n=1 Tax=Fulvivirga maritima TaxID=2904247 RepID=UPI001F2165FE|nr:hypothetical protein [Fulvivirga maritima]UII25898.1 hypothetical protein LVD15_21755 [Fulvivirga maritima]